MITPFYHWVSCVREVKNAPSHFKKLSQDIGEDADAPQRANTLIEWQTYLKSKNACKEALQALDAAWAIYWDLERREPYHGY